MGRVFANPLTELIEFEEMNRELQAGARFRSVDAWILRKCI